MYRFVWGLIILCITAEDWQWGNASSVQHLSTHRSWEYIKQSASLKFYFHQNTAAATTAGWIWSVHAAPLLSHLSGGLNTTPMQLPVWQAVFVHSTLGRILYVLCRDNLFIIVLYPIIFQKNLLLPTLVAVTLSDCLFIPLSHRIIIVPGQLSLSSFRDWYLIIE